MITNWAGNIAYSADAVHRPASVAQLQELVARTPRLRALGTRHSFNRIADTDGAFVSVAGLPADLSFGADTVSVAAGMRYGELAAKLDARGIALHNLASLPHISVAGACATATHGSGERNGNLATAVRAIEFVAGTGELVRLTESDPDFAGVVVSLGALGVITRLTLATEPAYELRQDVWLDLPLTTVLERLDEIMAAAYSVSVFTSWRRDVADLVWLKSRTAPEIDGWGARPATEAQHPIRGADPAATTQQLGVPGAWHDRLPHFRMSFTPSSGAELQSEWFVPRTHGADAIAAVRSIAAKIADALFVCELRAIAADSLWLSPMRGRASLGLHFTWRPELEPAVAAIRVVESALEPYDPRPHWAKVFERPPRADPAFRALVDRYDPDRRFANAFLSRYVY